MSQEGKGTWPGLVRAMALWAMPALALAAALAGTQVARAQSQALATESPAALAPPKPAEFAGFSLGMDFSAALKLASANPKWRPGVARDGARALARCVADGSSRVETFYLQSREDQGGRDLSLACDAKDGRPKLSRMDWAVSRFVEPSKGAARPGCPSFAQWRDGGGVLQVSWGKEFKVGADLAASVVQWKLTAPSEVEGGRCAPLT